MMSLKNATLLLMLCIPSAVVGLTLDCPPNVCIGAEIQLTCQSNAENLIGLSWTHKGDDVLDDPRYNVKTNVVNGVSTITFVISPFDNGTKISCIETSVSGGRETCKLYVDPIPPVTNLTYDGETQTLTWKEPVYLPKDYRYSIAIDDGNTTTVENTTDLSLTIDNISTCTNFSVTVVNCRLNDTCNSTYTSIPTNYYFKLRDQEGIQLSSSFEYMDIGNSCFSLKFKAYSNWFCPGMFYLSDSSNLSGISFSVKETTFLTADVWVEICDEGEPPAIATAVIRNKVSTSEQVEITFLNYDAYDEDTIPWNGGVVNISSCLSMDDNTSLTGTECFSEGVLFKSCWSSFVIFNHDNTVALYVFNVTIQAQSSSGFNNPTSPSFGLRPSFPRQNSTFIPSETHSSAISTNGPDNGGDIDDKFRIPVYIIVSAISLAIFLTAIVVGAIFCCKRYNRSKRDEVDFTSRTKNSEIEVIVELHDRDIYSDPIQCQPDPPTKENSKDPSPALVVVDTKVDNPEEVVTPPSPYLPPQEELTDGIDDKSNRSATTGIQGGQFVTPINNGIKRMPKPQTDRMVEHEGKDVNETAVVVGSFADNVDSPPQFQNQSSQILSMQ